MPYTKRAPRVAHLQVATEFNNSNDAPSAVHLSASLEASFMNDANPGDISYIPLKTVSFNLLDPALAALTIVAAGETVTYPKLAALLRKACLDQGQAQGRF